MNSSQKPYKNNIEVQSDIADLESYLMESLQLSFPMMTIKAIGDYTQDEDGDLVGFFVEDSGAAYHFVIQQADPNPMIQRIRSFEGEQQVQSTQPKAQPPQK